MTTTEVITVSAILAGPILAVVVQIYAEKRKLLRDAQTMTFRMLAGTRHLPSDPAYSTAINMTPLDFNKVPRVMSAYNAYIEAIRYKSAPENAAQHEIQVMGKQTKLIFEMSKHLGYDLPETEIQANPYAADGFITRDNIMLDAWRSWPRIAQSLEMQTQWMSAQQSDDSK